MKETKERSVVAKVKCEYCDRYITKINYTKHLRAHLKGNVKKPGIQSVQCDFCGRIFSTINGCNIHRTYCRNNPNAKIKLGFTAWNKGLSKDSDNRVASYSNTLKTRLKGCAGRKHTKEEKEKISNSRKKYLEAHPDRVPYLLNHSSKQSYPEFYFQELFNKEQIPLEYHLTVGIYELDFYNKTYKIDVEIDGEQHYTDPKMPDHDLKRTQYLNDKGWTVYRIRWATYQKMSFEQKQQVVNDIRNLLL